MSAIACPRCQTPSVTEPEMGVAQCASCGLVYEVSAAQVEAFDEANPPYGVGVHRDGDTLVLTLPWSADVTLAGHILQFVFPLAIGALFGMGAVSPTRSGRQPDPFALAMAGVCGAAVLALMVYAAICYVVNRTTVEIGPGGVEVSHGPLPTHVKGVSLAPGRVGGLRARTVMVSAGRSGTIERYALESRDGMLLTKWVREEPLQYVLGAIHATLPADAVGSPEAPARGRVASRERQGA